MKAGENRERMEVIELVAYLMLLALSPTTEDCMIEDDEDEDSDEVNDDPFDDVICLFTLFLNMKFSKQSN